MMTFLGKSRILSMKFYNRKLLLFGAKLLISVIVIWFLTRTAQLKFDLLADAFHRPLLLTLVVILFLAMIVVSAWRWSILNAAQGIHLGFLHTVMLTYSGVAFNNVLPGAVGGDFVRLHYLFKKIPDKKSSAVFAVFFDRIIGLIGIFVPIFFIAMIEMNYFKQQQVLFYWLVVCSVFCIGGLTALTMLAVFSQRMKFSVWLSQRFPDNRWIKPIIALFDTVGLYRNAKLAILKGLMISVLMQLLMVVAILVIAKMMNFPAIPFAYYLIAMGVTQIVNLIPVAPGGFGVGEMAFAKVLILLNPGVGAAFATIFLAYRLISMLTYLPGVISYIPIYLFLKKSHACL